MDKPSFAGKRVLLLQGPVGPFFWNLAKDLRAHGAQVFKFNFNAGDWLFYPRNAKAYRGNLQDWPAQLEAFLRAQTIDAVLVFGDCRPVHACVRDLCKQLGCALGVFEEGYLRPDYVTFEPFGVNGHSVFGQGLREWLFERTVLDTQEPAAEPTTLKTVRVGNTYWHAAMWGMAYFFAAWLGQKFWNNALHHRPMTVADAPWWWLSYGRKAWYKLTERGMEAQLCNTWHKDFFLVPLQVYNDAQISVHSDFGSVCEFIDLTMRSFAQALKTDQDAGPPTGGQSIARSLLVFKHHPMDRGHRHYGKVIKLLTRRYGLKDRVLYIHDQHLPTLLKSARGVVVVNSTVGLSALGHGAPVKVCGAALYDMPGLTFQGKLREFWHLAHTAVPEKEVVMRFKHALVSRTQLNGSFYRKIGKAPWQCGVFLNGQIAQRLWPATVDTTQVVAATKNKAKAHKRSGNKQARSTSRRSSKP